MEHLFHRNSLLPRFTALACALCVVVFIGLALGGSDATWQQHALWGDYPTEAIWTGKPWALITSVFVHFEIWHIAFNLYWLWILGNALEDAIGAWKWLAFFVAAAWVSSAAQLLLSGDTGIGMSGVVYALFGFGWVARDKVPEFKRLLDDRTVVTFLLWFVGCIVGTAFNLVHIGNAAHGAGLLFGVAVAAFWVMKGKRRALGIAGTLFLMASSFVPLKWCPQSLDWTSLQAGYADEKGDYPTAIHWYERTIARGGDESWALFHLAVIYSEQGNRSAYAATLVRLRRIDAPGAAQLEGRSNRRPSRPNAKRGAEIEKVFGASR